MDLLLEEEVGLRERRRFRNALKLSGWSASVFYWTYADKMSGDQRASLEALRDVLLEA